MRFSILLASFVASVLASPTPTIEERSPTIEKRAVRTSAPAGCLSVGSSATYKTVQSAINALGTTSTATACIFINPGTYTEQVVIQYKGLLTVYGSTTDTSNWKANTATITFNKSAGEAGSGEASATFSIKSNGLKLYNVNVKNSFGTGSQAIALHVNASKVGVYGCYITGYQDTLYARYGTQYYSNCLIEGAADYIYGDASAWFGECTIQSTAAGFITAMGRATNDEATWYAFDHSTIQGKSGVSLTKKVWLGRPWRVFARVIYQNSVLTDIIQPEGWTTMAEGATPLYYEINNTGAGSSTSSRKYETKISAAVTKTIVLGSDYATWIDGSY